MGLFNSSKDFFGLDIGATSVRVVQIQKGSGKPAIVAYGVADIPVGISESDSKLDIQNLADVIKKLLIKTKISTKNVVTALPGASVFTAVLKLPLMNRQELSKAIRFQAEQNIPLKIDEVKIDWQIIKEDPVNKVMTVMIVAAPNYRVQRAMLLMERIGLEVEALETSSIAVSRSLYNSSDPLFLVLDIGNKSTEITVVENGIVSHIRALPSGGEAFTRAISRNLGLDPTQAEQFKRKFGLAQDKLEGQVCNAIKPILKGIIEEIERSIKYYSEEFGANIPKIILVGGSVKMPELATFIKSSLKIEVVYGNPWAKINYPASYQEQLQKNSLDFNVAVGLALRDN